VMRIIVFIVSMICSSFSSCRLDTASRVAPWARQIYLINCVAAMLVTSPSPAHLGLTTNLRASTGLSHVDF